MTTHAIVALPLLVLVASGAPALELELSEWRVPWPASRPRDPVVAPDGIVWFVGQQGDYLGRFDPAREAFEKIDVDSGAVRHMVYDGAADAMWFGTDANTLVRARLR